MQYPHKRYLIYLLTKKFNTMEIIEECLRLRLLPPSESDISAILSSLGTFPSSWELSFNRDNEYFCKWLRSKGVISMWRQDDNIQEAVRFMYRYSVRKDFETLMVSSSSLPIAKDTLALKFPAHMVPSIEILETFCSYFWDLSSLSGDDLFEFLGAYHNSTANLAAARGNTSLAYAEMGIVEKVDAREFYNNLIALANTQVVRARRAPEILTGSSLMGIAAISRQALEAIKERDSVLDEQKIEVLDIIREQAAAFQMRTIVSDDIPTLSELTDLDNDPKEEEHVRKLTIATD